MVQEEELGRKEDIMTRTLGTSRGKGALPLGSKAGNVSATFSGGRGTTTSTRRVAVGKNSPNPKSGNKRTSLSLSKKDGQRSGGSPAQSNKSRGPSGITSKKGRLR